MLYTCVVTVQVDDGFAPEDVQEVLETFDANMPPAINMYVWGNGIARAIDVTSLALREE